VDNEEEHSLAENCSRAFDVSDEVTEKVLLGNATRLLEL
jgi:hypothetical protein